MYKLIAWIKGYRAAYDCETGKPVIFNGSRGLHFYSWRDAALHG